MYQPVLKYGQSIDNPNRSSSLMPVNIDPRQLPPSFPMSMGAPALAPQQQPQQQPTNQPALAGATGNARGSTRQPALQVPTQRIGLGEALIRMAGAGDAAASQGGLASMGAMTDAYGNIMDYNRAREMEEYNAQVAAANEEQRRKDALAARMAKSSGKAKGSGDEEGAAKALLSLQNAQDVLDGFKRRDGVVGWGSFFLRGWDQLSGDERENIRLKIQSMKVDRVLANIARTKGAISEKEMDIFMSDQPSMYAGEEIWTKWVEDYIEALRVMHKNLRDGTTVDGSTTSSPASTAVSEDILNEADSIVNGG